MCPFMDGMNHEKHEALSYVDLPPLSHVSGFFKSNTLYTHFHYEFVCMCSCLFSAFKPCTLRLNIPKNKILIFK